MNVTRLDDAPEYHAPNHFDMTCLRLQGHEASPAEQLWMGMSIIEPGGYIALGASPIEKLYLVLDGELEFTAQLPDAEPTTEVLRTWDSCRIAPGEARQLTNRSARSARVLLAMPLSPPSA